MSTNTPRPGGVPPRRAPFAAVVVALLGFGLVGQLVLNTSLQHGSFERLDLAAESAELDEVRQDLERQLAEREDPTALAARAEALGMVASENPVFLRLADGAVEGTPVLATAPPPPPPPPPPSTPPPTTPAATAPAVTPPATIPPAVPAPQPNPAPTTTGAQ